MEDFINKLSEQQAQNALMIAEKAKEMGIDPRLAIAIAYQESGLNQAKTGGSGEIGMMQVMPNTGKMLGFSPDSLKNPETNVEAGLTYLKQGMEKFNDPMLAAAGYNAGMDHPYFENPEKNSLPSSTVSYVKSIEGLGGFVPTPKPKQEQPAPAQATAQAPAAASEEDFAQQKRRAMTDVLGAGTGAMASTGMSAAKAGVHKAGQIGQFLNQMASAAPGVQSAAPGPQSATSGANWLKNWGNIQKPGFSGGVPEAAAQYNLMKPQGKITGALAKRGLTTPQPVQPGVFTGGQLSIQGVQAPNAAAPAARGMNTVKGALGSMGQMAGKVINNPVTSGAMGGLSMAESAPEAYERFKKGDYPGAAMAGAGALGGAMQMIPSPQTKAIGAGLSAASPLSLYLYDKMKQQKITPESPADQAAFQQMMVSP